MVIGKGYADRFLTVAEVREIIEQGLAQIDTAGNKLLFIIPDSPRSAPMPLLFRLFAEALGDTVARLDFMIALGTHMAMPEEHLLSHLGITAEERATKYAKIGILNHDWQHGLATIGTIPAAEMSEISHGLMAEDVPVQINEHIFEYDRLIICGPVFPHEVMGFSGGNKYLFPGISGADMIDFSHWLAALITNLKTIGIQATPTRRMIDRAAAMIDVPRSCFSLVVKGHHDLAGLYFGTPEESQEAAAALSAQVNIIYLDRSYDTVLSVMPELYDDIWTASKGMYKTEGVVADGGKVIIYAPGIDEVAYVHGKVLDRIGYHVRDYFLAHMDEMKDEPKSVMAHSTLVKGGGTYIDGVESPRINVVLATGIPRERCERINLGYMDPTTIDVEEWKGREEEGILVVPRAGEVLHRLRER